MVESIKKVFIKNYIFYLKIFLKLQSKIESFCHLLLKFEKNPQFLAFVTMVSPKLTCFWYFFTKVELFFLKNEKKVTFFPFLKQIC